jgi:26S proteasome non-ATPase regulatory subunit 9
MHAPTVSSGSTSHSAINGTVGKQTLEELFVQKENLEAELSALGSVLESVCLAIAIRSSHRHGD